MTRKYVTLIAMGLWVIGLTLPASGEQGSRKGKGAIPQEEVSVAQKYPGSKVLDDEGAFYSKDEIELVRAYYEKQFGKPFKAEESLETVCKDTTLTRDGKKVTNRGCVTISTARRHPAFGELERILGIEDQPLSDTDRELLAACQKYQYLAVSYFEKGDRVIQSIYDRQVKPVWERVNAEERKFRDEKSAMAKAAREERKNNPELRARDKERKEIRKKIKELKKEGRTDEALALAMQLRQEADGEISKAIADGTVATMDETTIKNRFSEEKNRAYIIFLQELAKEPAFRTRITIHNDELSDSVGGLG